MDTYLLLGPCADPAVHDVGTCSGHAMLDRLIRLKNYLTVLKMILSTLNCKTSSLNNCNLKSRLQSPQFACLALEHAAKVSPYLVHFLD